MYDTTLGRFLQRDAIGYLAGDNNLYGYVRENPGNATDPEGLQYTAYERQLERRYSPEGIEEQRRQDAKACQEWAEAQEKAGQGWLRNLRDCPCNLGGYTTYFLNFCWFTIPYQWDQAWNPNPAVWEDPSQWKFGYHPGAKWCMREKMPPGAAATTPGQQCCYDKDGRLITKGEGAGTPDKISPGVSVSGHRREDVTSYDQCKNAGLLNLYFKHRPPNQGKKPDGSKCDENEKP